MSGKIMGAVMRARLPASAKAVLMVYAYHANDQDQTAWPSQETVAEMSSLKLRAVQDWIPWLKEQQLLLPAGTDGHKTKRFRVNLVKLAELAPQKPAPDAVYTPPEEEKPAPDAENPEEKPAPAAEKPAPNAGYSEKPAPAAQKPAPGAPKTVKDTFNLNSKKQQESAAAADEPPPATRPRKPTNPAEAARIWTNVTGMIAIPGDLAAQDLILAKILDLADRHGDQVECYLRPFWQAMTLAKNKQGRAYSRTQHFWLTTWAIGDEIPELTLAQVRGRTDIPPELAEYIKTHNPAGPAIKKAGGQGLTKEQLEAEYQRSKGAKQ